MTPNEAREAIAGRRAVSVFFADAQAAARIRGAKVGARVGPKDGAAGTVFAATVNGVNLVEVEPVELGRGLYWLPMFGGKQQAAVVSHISKQAGLTPPEGLGFLPLVVEDEKGERYLLCERPTLREVQGSGGVWSPQPARSLPKSATLAVENAKESAKEKRQRERYEACVDAGLPMPTNAAATLPRGIGEVAKSLGIKHQSLSADAKAHIKRLADRRENGR